MHLWETNSIEQYYVKPVLLQAHTGISLPPDEIEYSLEKLLDFDRDIFITGAPGSGKTSLLKYVEYVLNGSTYHKPIFIPLRDIRHIDIKEINATQESKKIVFLLDGLDEVPYGSRKEAMAKIEELKYKHPGACFLITSRLYESQEERVLSGFIVLHISELNDSQLENLFRVHGVEDWRSAYSIIQSSVALRSAVRNPFMAKLIIQYFDVIESKNYIVDPTMYIGRLVEDYVYKASYSAEISEKYLDALLEEIAALLHYKETQILSEEDICGLFRRQFNGDSDFNVNAFLDEMRRGYIFREERPNWYSFAHKSIFEHFLTKHLRRLIGYPGSKLILDTNQSVVTAIKLKGFRNPDTLKSVLISIEKRLGLSASQFTPAYARAGSIEVLLVLAIGGVTFHAIKKFADGYLTKMGHIAAEKNTSHKEPIELPREITKDLPAWLREDERAMEIFTNELIQQYARNSINGEKETVSIAINSVLTAQYGNCYERLSLSQFNDVASLSNENSTRKI